MKKLLTILTAITLFQGIARAQQYPVQVTPQLLPPYSVQVSDYYSPGAAGTKLNLLLLLRDFNKPQLQVRLRMSIEGQSVSLRSRQDAVFTPITIESGIPTYIDPSALAQYFNPDNLDFSGITRQQYEQTGKLPEGFYTFCFEAIEISTNQSVSNKGCTFAWMTLNEPPILNIPRKAEGVIPGITPQDIIFQWTPRHTASPTAAFTTDYTFSIVEMEDNDISPELAFISREPLRTEVETTTTVSYNADWLGLVAGRKYAWRVQAKAKIGIQDLATFRNQGYSETFWFIYQNNCAVPSGVTASAQGQRVTIEWNANPVHLEYKVEYREANDADAVWFEIGNTLPRVSIADLKPSTIYQYRVGGACEYGRYTFGNLLEFTTNGENSSTVPSCGTDPNLVTPPQTQLAELIAGDIIHAGDYDITVTNAAKTGTTFSGEGYVKMSWLAGANVAVRFTNIGINTDYKLASGVIETTYDPTESQIIDVKELEETLSSLINVVNKLLQIDIDRNASQIKTLVDGMLEGAKQDLPAPLQQLIEEAATELLAAKYDYDEAKKKYETLTDPVAKEAAYNEMEQAKQKFDLAKEKLADVKKQRDTFLKQYNNLVKAALTQILLEHNDSIQIVKNELTQASDDLMPLFGTDTPEFSDSLFVNAFEFGELDAFPADAIEDNLLKDYFEKEFKYNRCLLSKWFSIQMNNDRSAEELSAEIKKDGKTLGKIIYDLKSQNIVDDVIIEEIKKIIYLRIEDIIIEKIYSDEKK